MTKQRLWKYVSSFKIEISLILWLLKSILPKSNLIPALILRNKKTEKVSY